MTAHELAADAHGLRDRREPATVAPPDEVVPTSDWQPLPAATLRAWQVDNGLGLVVAGAALAALAALGRPEFSQPWLLPLAGLAVVLAAVESALVLPRLHRRYRYRVTSTSVVVESGALVRVQLVVPLHQVLYVETHQGPVLRAFGLTRLRLGTIADPKSVGPLAGDAAQALRRAVEAGRTRSGDAEHAG
jgi:hypothetical protein